jgi:uncharacterized protein YjbJ (UPF0337 family)
MPETKNKVEGAVKKAVGKATGNKKLEAKGKAQETRGKANEVQRKGKEKASVLRGKAKRQASKG